MILDSDTPKPRQPGNMAKLGCVYMEVVEFREVI